MPLGRSELAAVHQAAALSAQGVTVKWRIRRDWPRATRVLAWYRADSPGKAEKVCSALIEDAFSRLCREAQEAFRAEVTRLAGGQIEHGTGTN